MKTVLSIPDYFFWGDKAYTKLCITCSLEHLTAILASLLLESKEGQYFICQMAPSHQTLWLWHALEEAEHKAVAFDVYNAVGGSPILRVIRHIYTQIIFLVVLFYIYFRFMGDGGRLFDLRGHGRLFCFLWLQPGFFRLLWRPWIDYLRLGFHPWDHDNREVIKKWHEVLRDQQSVYIASHGRSVCANAETKIASAADVASDSAGDSKRPL